MLPPYPRPCAPPRVAQTELGQPLVIMPNGGGENNIGPQVLPGPELLLHRLGDLTVLSA